MTSQAQMADLIVIGGGLAGLVAATRAIELGLRPVVVEQGAETGYRCNSRSSGGIFHVAYHDPQTDPATLASAIRAANSDEVHEELADSVAGNAGRLIDWLGSHGVSFVRASSVDWHRWTAAPPRPIRWGLDFAGRGVDVILNTLAAKVKANGQLLLGHRATDISRPGGDILRVTCATANGVTTLDARAVIVADGGFQANAEMLREHITPRPDLLVQRGAGNGRGDGIRMAVALGGAITQANRFYGHLLHRDALSNERLWPYPMLDTMAVASVLVDASGRRFADERLGGIYLANMVAALNEPASATIILDEAVWQRTATKGLYPADPNLEKMGGSVIRAETLKDLANQLAIDADALTETLTKFNSAAVGDHRAGLRSPYLAIPVCAGITHTMGGLVIDGQARVVDRDGVPIAGLYAVGSSTGGLEGGGFAGYVGGLTKAGVTGLLAAEHLAHGRGYRQPSVADGTPSRQASITGSIREYRLVRAVVGHGHLVCILCALAALLAVGLLASPYGPVVIVAAALASGFVAYGLTRLMVETLTLIVRLLLPEDG